MSAEMIDTEINGRWHIKLPAHRAARPEWDIKNGGWEKPRLDSMYEAITGMTHPVVFYVGSEEGDMSALCQMWGAQLVLFEPNPKVWSNTRAIWEANGLETPICIEGFASDQTTRKDWESFVYINEWPENAYRDIEAAHGFKELNKEGETYPQITISELVGYGNIPYPDIVTMDVEGAEGHVLRGMASLMASPRKPIIFLSLHPEFLREQYGEWGRELRNWIIDFGYRETLLDYEHEVHLRYESK